MMQETRIPTPIRVVAFVMTVALAAGLTQITSGCGSENSPGNPGGSGPADTIPARPILAGHEAVVQFALIPDSVFSAIRANSRIFYGHTSHGSQIITGLQMLAAGKDPTYEPPPFDEVGSDLGHLGNTAWADDTRTWLDDHPGQVDVVMWSWCGGCSDNSAQGIRDYLAAMEQLEAEYPTIAFIYMTGHLDGSGSGGNLHARNEQIREYCAANEKILFDFADIESYDPAGNHYPDASDDCDWCETWCTSHTCPDCSSCAHSHCFNCYLKGKVFWWMMARIAGWGVPDATKTWSARKSLYR